MLPAKVRLKLRNDAQTWDGFVRVVDLLPAFVYPLPLPYLSPSRRISNYICLLNLFAQEHTHFFLLGSYCLTS